MPARPPPAVERPTGRLYAGTSGFAYPAWAPTFYPAGLPGSALLGAYSARLAAVELNNTFYRRPSEAAVQRWLASTPEPFRFCPKAQRGSAWRIWSGQDPSGSMGWLSDSLRTFGSRLGCVLMAVPPTVRRDDASLLRVLEAWPSDLRLALELPHPSWADDEVHAHLRLHDVALVATDRDGQDEPDLRRIGRCIYLRLRRSRYSEVDLERWARRLEPFLGDGLDAFVFFRHDDDGTAALHAERLAELSSRA